MKSLELYRLRGRVRIPSGMTKAVAEMLQYLARLNPLVPFVTRLHALQIGVGIKASLIDRKSVV